MATKAKKATTAKDKVDLTAADLQTFALEYEEDLRQGLCPRAASAMEMLADHYGIPSVNVALPVVQMNRDGRLIFKSGEPAPDGVIRFSSDGVHPLDEGHEIYTNEIGAAVKSMMTSVPAW